MARLKREAARKLRMPPGYKLVTGGVGCPGWFVDYPRERNQGSVSDYLAHIAHGVAEGVLPKSVLDFAWEEVSK